MLSSDDDPDHAPPSSPRSPTPNADSDASLRPEDATPPAGSEPSTGRPLRRQELERYLQTSPADLAAYRELADIYRDEERPAEAARVLKRALEFHPDDQRLLWDFEEATLARSLQQLREVTSLAARLKTMEAEREKERCETNWAFRRMDVCRARLQRNPHDHHLRLTLAQTLKDLQRFAEAIEEAERAANDPASAPTAHLIRAQCLEAIGDRVAALPAYRAAALRRSNPAPPRIRRIALRAAVEIAETLGLDLSAQRYRQFLKLTETELVKPTEPPALSEKAVITSPTGSLVSHHQQDRHESSDR